MGDWETDTTRTTATKSMKEGVIHDQGLFQHDTGDTYNGCFEARRKDRSFEMRGPGVYTTAEGDTYTGVWEADRLGGEEDVTVLYKDGSKYEGGFRDWSYSGRGRYSYPDGSLLQAVFIQNAPVGELTLVDPNGHRWLGTAETGYGWLEPVNHYYDMLEDEPRKRSRRSKLNPAKVASEN